jgi:lysophospholipase L1-like esterase
MRCRTLLFVLLSASALMIAGCEQLSTSPKVDVTVWPGPVPSPPPPAVPKRITYTKYLAFGDSLTEGLLKGIMNGDVDPKTPGPPSGYPFKLLSLLSAKYVEQTIVMYDGGLAGRLARDDAEEGRLAFVLAQLPQTPEVMILMHGVNDLIDGRSIASTIEHVQDLVDQAHARGMLVLLSTLPPERDGGIKGVGNALVNTYNNALKTQVSGATLIDVNPAVTPAMIGPDGLHLLEIGNAALAAAYFARIAALYEFQPTATEIIR